MINEVKNLCLINKNSNNNFSAATFFVCFFCRGKSGIFGIHSKSEMIKRKNFMLREVIYYKSWW